MSTRRAYVLVVLGATGTGKSKLAIQLAKAFSGEVISADSMQVYRGLDVATNKVTAEEMEGVPHHCLGFLDPRQTFTVRDFRDMALPIVERLLDSGKCAVVVGGTHYYIESLLWDVLVQEAAGAGGDRGQTAELIDTTLQPTTELRLICEELDFLNLSAQELAGRLGGESPEQILARLSDLSQKELEQLLEEGRALVAEHHTDRERLANRRLHERLRELDPRRASQLHYNDIRKIKRSLEVVGRSGGQQTHSELLAAQREGEGGSQLGGPLRYPGKTLLFWLSAQQDVLDQRLDARVDDMIERGLIKEIDDFYENYMKGKDKISYTEGVFQSIGLKEFHPYLTCEEEDPEVRRGKLAGCVEGLKLGTRRYARRQVKWIKGRFLRATGRQVPDIYKLDATDPTADWEEKVWVPASRLVRHHLRLPPPPGEEDLPPPPLPQPCPRVSPPPLLAGERTERLCRVCSRIFIGDFQWEAHIKSKKHQSILKKKKKQKLNEDTPQPPS